MREIDVRIDSQGCDDLILSFDLEASIISAESTILSAIKREESRGAHQRSDYQGADEDKLYNVCIKLINGDLDISSEESRPLSKEFRNLILRTQKIRDFKGKLIE